MGYPKNVAFLLVRIRNIRITWGLMFAAYILFCSFAAAMEGSGDPAGIAFIPRMHPALTVTPAEPIALMALEEDEVQITLPGALFEEWAGLSFEDFLAASSDTQIQRLYAFYRRLSAEQISAARKGRMWREVLLYLALSNRHILNNIRMSFLKNAQRFPRAQTIRRFNQQIGFFEALEYREALSTTAWLNSIGQRSVRLNMALIMYALNIISYEMLKGYLESPDSNPVLLDNELLGLAALTRAPFMPDESIALIRLIDSEALQTLLLKALSTLIYRRFGVYRMLLPEDRTNYPAFIHTVESIDWRPHLPQNQLGSLDSLTIAYLEPTFMSTLWRVFNSIIQRNAQPRNSNFIIPDVVRPHFIFRYIMQLWKPFVAYGPIPVESPSLLLIRSTYSLWGYTSGLWQDMTQLIVSFICGQIGWDRACEATQELHNLSTASHALILHELHTLAQLNPHKSRRARFTKEDFYGVPSHNPSDNDEKHPPSRR